MRTLGIDLAANPAKTAGCSIDWAEGTFMMLDRPVDDDAIVRAVRVADRTGIDVPFGWPDGFVAAVASHHGLCGWPPVDVDAPVDRVPLRFRRTDLALMDDGARPLSVSTDRIGVAAMRGARIFELLARSGLTVDRSGTSGCVAEVYPAAALRAWGIRSSGYKGSKNRAICREVASAFAGACGSLSERVAGCLEDADDDDLDAIVCAFVAKAVVDGDTRPPVARSESCRSAYRFAVTLRQNRTRNGDRAGQHIRRSRPARSCSRTS